MLLPQDEHFLEILEQKHGIVLTERDLICLQNFYQQQSQDWDYRLAHDLNSVYYDISGGKILAVVAFAVVGFFAAPLLGVAGIAGALIGASIGWRLLGGGKEKEKKKTAAKDDSNPQSSQTFGFNSAPSIAPIGGVLPLVFTNVYTNPKGGVRASGVLLNTRVSTRGGVQKFHGLYSLCLGRIQSIRRDQTLINKQPLTNFFVDEILAFERFGDRDQLPSPEFQFYSQCITVSTNSFIGISPRGLYKGSSGFNSNLLIEPERFDSFSPGDTYDVNGQEFRIVSKNRNNNTISINRQITISTNDRITLISKFVYETSKPCTSVEINIVAQLWARDANNKLMTHGSLFRLVVNDVIVCNFFIAASSEGDIRRMFGIKNLPFTRHNIKLIPLSTNDNRLTLRLVDNQMVSSISTNAFITPDKNIIIDFERDPAFNQNTVDINNIIGFSGKNQTSSDRAATCQVTTVNEIVYPVDMGHSAMCGYPRQVTGELIASASDRLQSDPSPSWQISEGILGKDHLATGYANAASTSQVLFDPLANFVADGLAFPSQRTMIRNLETGATVAVDYAMSATQIFFSPANLIAWKSGDRYVIYRDSRPINNFPDVYVWSLTERFGGLGGILDEDQIYDYFIDFPSIIKSKKFCITNGYFWDGSVTEPTSWASWANQESLGSLLYPTRFGGKFGLIPERATSPVALFNASNIGTDSYVEEYVAPQRLNCVHVIYTDNSNQSPVPKPVSILTLPAYHGTVPLLPETVRLDAVTNEYQAIRVGQIYLKSKLLQDLVVNFTTGLQGYGLREGDLIIVQHVITEIEKECSGFVLEAGEFFQEGKQRVVISAPTSGKLNELYSAAIFRLTNASIQNNLKAEVFDDANDQEKKWIEILGLQSPLSSPREDYTGDYVVIGKDIEKKRTFRVQKLEPQKDGSISITAVLWLPEILRTDDLVTVN